MENIETLLAAVAQAAQGLDDDDDVNSPALGLQNSAPSPITPVEMAAAQPTEVEGEDWPSVEVYPLPLAAVPANGYEKKKRGRPSRGQLVVKPPLPKRSKQEDDDEDVCFICFDGGTLVLCDRKGCPKAYHTACIKRDEAFFKTKAKWNCGWHICSVCRKGSHYMCYTCTYSLCKGCTKNADYLSVRGNKGFCSTCMKIIMLIENKDQPNNDSVKVDFDDKLSWEYLFKVYWFFLKDKLSLTLNELTQAKNPWKGVSALACKPRAINGHYTAIDGRRSISRRISELFESNKPYEEIGFRQNDRPKEEALGIDNHVETQNSIKVEDAPSCNKDTEQPSIDKVADEPIIGKDGDNTMIVEDTNKDAEKTRIDRSASQPSTVIGANERGIKKPCICKHKDEPRDKDPEKPGMLNSNEWASADLLEFVAHTKNGNTSALSQFDVQRLLLEYIKRNNLRDPYQKSQIICDLRLTNLFGKARVGHIEMLKLLEFHFLIKEDVQNNSFIPAGFVGSSASDMHIDETSYGQTMPVKSRKRKARKKSEEKAPQNNLNEYAAIDFHNINLIYLRRNLMENLFEDKENFNDKVVGSIVRIKISCNDQKPDIHRLVQVVGTSKVSEPYKFGDKIADIMLEVLNLDKKEAVSIDSISNQEITEDECRRLRQSIRCGLMKQLTVSELQKKVMALKPVRLISWMEAEILRLNHLRDRASEKGRKKELREYVQKIQLLKSPEERQRRISEVSEIHSDPKMSPNYQSDKDSRSVDNNRKGEYVSPTGSRFALSESKAISPIKKGKGESSNQSKIRTIVKIGADGSRSLEKRINHVSAIGQAIQRPGLETSTATASMGISLTSDNIETEKLWHYRDPNGKIQGPFAMIQLRKWSTTGLFPPDMRIWTNHEQYDSLLLTDALNGKFHGVSEWPHKSSSDARKHGVVTGNGKSKEINSIGSDSKQTEAASSNNAISHGTSELPHNSPADTQKDEAANGIGRSEGIYGIFADDKQIEVALSNHAISHGSSELPHNSSSDTQEDKVAKGIGRSEGISGIGAESGQTESATSNHAIDLSDRSTVVVKADEISPSWPHCWDLLKDNNSSADDVQEHIDVAPYDRGQENIKFNCVAQTGEKNSSCPTKSHIINGPELQNQFGNQGEAVSFSEENLALPIDLMNSNNVESQNLSDNQGQAIPYLEEKLALHIDLMSSSNVESQNQSVGQGNTVQSLEEKLVLPIDLMISNVVESESVFIPAVDAIKQNGDMDVLDLNGPIPKTSDEHFGVLTPENQQSLSVDVPVQSSSILELLSPTPKPNIEDQCLTTDRLLDLSLPNCGPSWTNLVMGAELPDVADDWFATPAKPPVQEWDPGLAPTSSMIPPEVTNENITTSTSNTNNNNNNNNNNHHFSSWMALLNEPIEFDALGEEYVSDLLAEVDAMESQGGFPSPDSAMKFAQEFLLDCKDDCFSSIEEFSSTHDPGKSDAFSATGDVQLTSPSTVPCNPIDPLNSFRRSAVHSSASSEGETTNPARVYSREADSDFHPHVPNNTGQDMVGPAMAHGSGSEAMDPGWGTVQGNINLVTVQGNVNLVLGGHTQGMENLGWGNNPGTSWVQPNMNPSPRNGNGPQWDGQRKYGGPREWAYQSDDAGFGRGRAPWGRSPYGGGGYSRPLPKGQRVCKFYESGRCKKGAFCDYLHHL